MNLDYYTIQARPGEFRVISRWHGDVVAQVIYDIGDQVSRTEALLEARRLMMAWNKTERITQAILN
jgi:NADH:ubiquinone oxidoreductase subunit D